MPEIRSTVAANARAQIQTTSRGVLAETFPAAACSNVSIPVTGAANGTLVLGLVGLRAGDPVTNLLTLVGNIGTGLTFAKLGLFDAAGTFLAATANVPGTFNAGASVYKTVALTAPYTITTDGGYYVGFLQWGSGATGCQLRVTGSADGTQGAVIGSGTRVSAQVATQTDISGNVTLAAGTLPFWFGVN